MEKCSVKIESSFTLFSALKMKNIYKGGKTTNGERITNKIMVTVSNVATPLVIDKKVTTKFVDQRSLAI